MKKNAGFTLVELMVAMSIGIVVIVGGMIAGSRFNANQKVEAAASVVEETIRSARNLAMTRQHPASSCSTKLEYVKVVISGGTIEVDPGNNSVNDPTCSSYLVNTIDTAELTLSSTNNQFMFSVPEGKLVEYQNNPATRPVDIGESVAITVSSKLEVGTTRVITVNEFGAIK